MEWAKETLQKPMWKEEIKNREAKNQLNNELENSKSKDIRRIDRA